MSVFAPPAAALRAAPPDPHKHVNYTLGMVLGVDDFTQEFAYLSGRDQLLARELLGYGTICGLQVTIEPSDDTTERRANPQVQVGPGLAVTPRGQFVGVPAAQCATLQNWLAANRDKIVARIGPAATTTLPLYLVLCYRDCLTDQVPIPGEPCRSEDEAFAASRVTDDFKLDLRLDPPEQREEDALRDFVQWLNQVPIVEESEGSPVEDDDFADEAAWERAIRDAAFVLSSPPSSPPDFMYGAPPADLRVRAEDGCAFLRVAFRLWTTELRPAFLGRGQTCAGDPPDEGCLLLAELHLPLVAGALGGEVTLDEARRPYLLHLRMIQEWLLCGRREVLPSDIVVAETEFGELPDAGISERYSRADHTHGSPALGGDVEGTAGDLVVEGLRRIPIRYDEGGPRDGQVLTFIAPGEEAPGAEAHGSWQPRDPEVPTELDGDVTGPLDGNQISRLQGIPVEAFEPTASQVLTFSDGAWRANDPAPGLTDLRGDVVGPATDNQIENLQAVPVEAPDPTEGQVLTFSEGAWRPREPVGGITDLDGDVVGPANDNRIERLQGIPVEAAGPSPGQVLTFVQGEGGRRWIPANSATTNAVTHPPGLPPYQIVAAGLVALDGVRSPLTYNGLVARVIDDSRVLVAFDRYEPPNLDKFTYIVKALPEFSLEIRKSLTQQMDTGGMSTVAFEDFTVDIRDEVFPNGGFILFVCIGDRLIKRNILGRLQLMIEVSRYEVAG